MNLTGCTKTSQSEETYIDHDKMVKYKIVTKTTTERYFESMEDGSIVKITDDEFPSLRERLVEEKPEPKSDMIVNGSFANEVTGWDGFEGKQALDDRVIEPLYINEIKAKEADDYERIQEKEARIQECKVKSMTLADRISINQQEWLDVLKENIAALGSKPSTLEKTLQPEDIVQAKQSYE